MSEWLKRLKVGDEVFVRGNNGVTLSKVQRITPTGRIVVNNTQYIDGKSCSNMWNISILEEATERRIEMFYRKKFSLDVLRVLKKKTSITYDQAQFLNDILELGVEDVRCIKELNADK